MKRLVVAGLAGAALVVTTGAPAHAGDKFVGANNGGANATWTDGPNRLCVKAGTRTSSGTSIRYAQAAIWPVDGTGPDFSVRDETPGNGSDKCITNLNVPEDEEYYIRLTVRVVPGWREWTNTTIFT